MATNWNAVLANINNASDILAILRKVLGLLDGKVDLTKIDEIIADISSMQTNVDTALTNVNSALSEFDTEAQEAIQQVIAAGLMEGFVTEAELLATRPLEPKKYAKAEDTDVIWFWNKPDGSPEGSYWTSTGLSEYNRAINYVNANQFFKPTIINTPVDFRTLKTPGFYAFVSGQAWDASTNKPTGISNQWAFLEVFPISEMVVGQYVWCLNSQKKAFTFCNAVNVWAPWSIYSDDITLTNSIFAQLPTQLTKNLRATYKSQSKNLLDPNTLQTGLEIITGGVVSNEANGVTTELIDVRGFYYVSVSGLQANTMNARFYRFLDKSGVVVGSGNVTSDKNAAVLSVPDNAIWFQMTIKQRNSSPLDITTAQIEEGIYATSYTPFVKGVISGILGAAIEQPKAQLTYQAAGKNLLNKNDLMKGLAIWNQAPNIGLLVKSPTSVTTHKIYVRDMSQITLSGLQPNPEFARRYRFLDKDSSLLIHDSIPIGLSTYTITVPSGAEYFQVSLLEISATVLDASTTQIEQGAVATAFESFKPRVSAINDISLFNTSSGNNLISKAYGAKILICGDSTAQTSNVEAGIFDQLDYPSTTFVTYLFAKLGPSVLKNYAKGGASFFEYGQIQWRKLAHQVDTAIANNEDPNIIYVVAGTNDTVAGSNPLANLGSYETAISKATQADLNRALTLESARYCFWRLRQKWPNAVCFYCVPLQRADVESSARAPLNDGLQQMAERYGFNIINGHTDSGIIKDLEVWGANGQFTIDGLHPNEAGKQVYCNLVVSETVPRMMF